MKVQFNTDNAAFEENAQEEISRILCKIARQVETGSEAGAVIDYNGNKIGRWDITAEGDK